MASIRAAALKTPKGTKDWSNRDILLRDHIFSIATRVFRAHGGVALDTPVFERREILEGKYGQESKLIYNLEDQGGELLSLRYDLTVPFARWLAMNNVSQIKRFQIAKVYRRDQPAIAKGRMREFYQCDFDIAGSYDPMIPDAEILKILYKILADLDIGSFVIKLNHRKLLDAVFHICGVPQDQTRTVCSSVDKLDKLDWDSVRNELVSEKEIPLSVVNDIEKYINLKGGTELISTLENDPNLTSNQSALAALDDLKRLFSYLSPLGILDKISFDLSLARGLDYYTGIIYEAVTNSGIGSVAAGGRYDDLVGMFSQKPKVPCVGVSIGVERVFSILKSRSSILPSESVDVYVMAFGGGKDWTGFMIERLKICNILWEAGIKAELLYKEKPKPRPQFDAAERGQVPLAVILGQSEWEKGQVRVKRLGLKEEANQGDLVSIEDLVLYIQSIKT